MAEWIKKLCAQTSYTRLDADEAVSDWQQEEADIEEMRSNPGCCQINAWVNGQFAGCCSFSPVHPGRKSAHRCEIGIALLQEYTGRHLGELLLGELLLQAEKSGYLQAELSLCAENAAALALYTKFGFSIWGRIPNALRLGDGSCLDDLHMYKKLRTE